jgi:hypothetical protein
MERFLTSDCQTVTAQQSEYDRRNETLILSRMASCVEIESSSRLMS